MTHKFLMVIVGATALISGCATKGYVRKNVTPVQDKLNQVSDQANKTDADLQKTQQDVAKNTQAISATDEKATTADRRAGDAMNRANQANDAATAGAKKEDSDIAQLRGVISNLDDYKVANQATVLFKFNSAVLSDDDKQQLDQLASNAGSMKRYFIAVEGYTDTIGTAGLGDNNPVDPGKTAAARAKNRRVEVKVFSADSALSASGGR